MTYFQQLVLRGLMLVVEKLYFQEAIGGLPVVLDWIRRAEEKIETPNLEIGNFESQKKSDGGNQAPEDYGNSE